MSSSISSSEHPVTTGPAGFSWRQFGLRTVLATAGLFIGVSLFLILFDPYDTGRLTWQRQTGIAATGPWAANASRARNPAFNAAITGNSRMQMLEPAALDRLTGASFVNLVVQGTSWPEQTLILDRFIKNHPSPQGLVIGLDESWCEISPQTKPFPEWLYAASDRDYLRGLIRMKSLERVWPQFMYLLGLAKGSRPDGFDDYTAYYLAIGGEEAEALAKRLALPRPVNSRNPENVFPAADRLEQSLKTVPEDASVILTWMPVFQTHLPEPGSAADKTIELCKARFSQIAQKRKATAIVDWQIDRQENRDSANYYDQIHYRRALADLFTQDIGQAMISSGKAGSSDQAR